MERSSVLKVKFVLTMDDLVVNNDQIDQVVFDWELDVDQNKILELSYNWITSKNFLTKKMDGLIKVGESSLTIGLLEEEQDVNY